MDPGEAVSVTLKREFGEEAMNTLEANPDEKEEIEEAIRDLFDHGQEVSITLITSEKVKRFYCQAQRVISSLQEVWAMQF